MKRLFFAVFVVALGASGCAVHKIPGTEIDDTLDTRAILSVMDAYRRAVEAKNPQSIKDLCDPSFKDDSGSPNPDDDQDYESLGTKLPAEFAKVDNLRLDINVRKIEVNKELDTATATYTYTVSFRMPQFTSSSKSEGDIKQMHFRRVGDHTWKIVSGI
jgi:hypothetical protein